MATSKLIFNHKKRLLRRSLITPSERYSSLVLLLCLALIGYWFLAQSDQFDPSERDLDPEQLLPSSSMIQLYTAPLKLWREPGGVTAFAVADINPYPAGTVSDNWQIAGRIRRFEPENLYEKINGEAEKFLRQGFEQLHYLVLRSVSGDAEIAIELFDQGDIPGSIGIFSAHQSSGTEVINKGPVSYFDTSVGMIGRKGRYFFRVAADQSGDEIKEKVSQLATLFADLVDDAEELPLEYHLLSDSLDLSADRIVYQATDVFQFDFVSDFWFGKLGDLGSARVFLHRDQSVESSRELFERIKLEQSYDYEIIEEEESLVIMQHSFLNTLFILQQRQQFLVGAEMLTDVAEANSFMTKLLEGIDAQE